MIRRLWAWLTRETSRRDKASLGRLLYPPRRNWMDSNGRVWDR